MKKTRNGKSPIKDLVKALKNDEGYYYSWQANIAMSFYDHMQWSGKRKPSSKDLNEIANKAAKHFLNLLIDE